MEAVVVMVVEEMVVAVVEEAVDPSLPSLRYSIHVCLCELCFSVKELYSGKFVSPYSLTHAVWDTLKQKVWKFPKLVVALAAPNDFEALLGDDKSKLERFAKELSTFVKAYSALAVASDEMKLKRLLTCVADDVLPAWSKGILEESWSSCSEATSKLDFPVSGVPMTYEVKLCAEFSRTGRCSIYLKQGCCWYGHLANILAKKCFGENL